MITLIPAYGRQYDTEDAARVDWKSGLDFKIVNGPYTSIRDINLLKADFGQVNILWQRNTGLYFTA